MINISSLTLSQKIERVRDVEENDKFYIVDIFAKNGNYELKGNVGYIEKEFNESVFIKKCPIKNITKVSVRIIFDNEKEYLEYKKNNDMPC